LVYYSSIYRIKEDFVLVYYNRINRRKGSLRLVSTIIEFEERRRITP
jgi:hypothetical protein